MKVQEAVYQYLKAAIADGLKPSTVKWYTSILNALIQHIGTSELDAVTPSDVRGYIIALRQRDRYQNAPQKPPQSGAPSDETVRAHITALRAFFAWAAREYGTPNPMQNVRRPRRVKPMPKAISGADFVRLFDACSAAPAGVRDRALLAFLADTGARLGGVLSLKISNLDVPRRRALVVEKGGKWRQVHFTAYTAGLLGRWLYFRRGESDYVFTRVTSPFTPLTVSGINQILKRLKQRAGITTGRVDPHSFRHAFAREYLLNGGDVVTLARLLGHEDVNTTAAHYAVFTDDELSETHNKYTPMNILRGEL